MIYQAILNETMDQPHSSKSFPDIICKGPCKKNKYAAKSFLGHLQQAKRCRLKYTSDEISNIQTTSELKVNENREDATVRLVSYLRSKG